MTVTSASKYTKVLTVGFFISLIVSTPTMAAKKCATPGAAINAERAHQFLIENAKAEGVVTTASGMQYKILQLGSGQEKPKASSEIVAHYDVYNLDNQKVDSSRDRGLPYQTRANKVIKGWTEALQDMTIGERRILYIPAELAYGCKGARPAIGGNELLIFDMELVHIVQPGD